MSNSTSGNMKDGDTSTKIKPRPFISRQHYSKTHKGSSTILQAVNGTYTATGSEYDLMKYAEQNPQDYDDKVVASEEDVLGLLAISQLTL